MNKMNGPLNMKDVNLSFLLSFRFSSLILVCVKSGLVHVVSISLLNSLEV